MKNKKGINMLVFENSLFVYICFFTYRRMIYNSLLKMYKTVHKRTYIVLYSYYIHTYKMCTNIREKIQTTEYDKQEIECVNKQPFYTGKKNNTNWSSEKV